MQEIYRARQRGRDQYLNLKFQFINIPLAIHYSFQQWQSAMKTCGRIVRRMQLVKHSAQELCLIYLKISTVWTGNYPLPMASKFVFNFVSCLSVTLTISIPEFWLINMAAHWLFPDLMAHPFYWDLFCTNICNYDPVFWVFWYRLKQTSKKFTHPWIE